MGKPGLWGWVGKKPGNSKLMVRDLTSEGSDMGLLQSEDMD